MRDYHDIIVKPLLTEKSTLMRESLNKVCFEVRKDANKIEIKKAIEEILKVKVNSVNVIRAEGKKKHLGRFEGRRNSWKKAIVTLNAGEKLNLFEGL